MVTAYVFTTRAIYLVLLTVSYSFSLNETLTALNSPLSSYRYEGKLLRGPKIKKVSAISEIQCLDFCLREPFCASVNFKRKKWSKKYVCQINKKSKHQTANEQFVDNENSTHFDINAEKISKVFE